MLRGRPGQEKDFSFSLAFAMPRCWAESKEQVPELEDT